jgi:hypothetical protein
MKPVTPEQIRKLQAKVEKAEQGFSGERMRATRNLLRTALDRYARQQLAREVVSVRWEVHMFDAHGSDFDPSICPSRSTASQVARNWRRYNPECTARIVKVTRYRRAK